MAQQTKKELVRLLSIEHGYKRASELANVDYAVVRQWAVRGKWKQKTGPSQIVTTAADALTASLAERKSESADHLSRYIVDASKRLADSNGELKHARPARDIVAARSGVWPEERQGETGLTLNLLNLVMPAESARRSEHEDE